MSHQSEFLTTELLINNLRLLSYCRVIGNCEIKLLIGRRLVHIKLNVNSI